MRKTSILLVFVCGVFAATCLNSFAAPQSTSVADINSTVQSAFGATLQPVKTFKPYYLTGDFNGDGIQDLLIIARVTGRRSEFPKDVHVMNPFDLSVKAIFPADPAKENRLAIAIVHSWKSPQPAGKFLLIGNSPILILDYDRAVSPRPEDSKDLMSLMRRRGPRAKGQKFPVTAKGDVILLGNQVGDNSLLYWNGRTYRWEDSEGGD